MLDWHRPNAKWFVGGKINAASNCLDRQVELGRATRPRSSGKASRSRATRGGEVGSITYSAARGRWCAQFANGLRKLGVGKGDRVTIYMPMVPEAVVAMLACA